MTDSVFPPCGPGQLDLADLPPGEKPENPCPRPGCPTVTQGGQAGLRAHVLVVHGGRIR